MVGIIDMGGHRGMMHGGICTGIGVMMIGASIMDALVLTVVEVVACGGSGIGIGGRWGGVGIIRNK